MPLYLVRWPLLSASLIQAENEDELIQHLDEVGDPSVCTWEQYDGPLWIDFELPCEIAVHRPGQSSESATASADGCPSESDGAALSAPGSMPPEASDPDPLISVAQLRLEGVETLAAMGYFSLKIGQQAATYTGWGMDETIRAMAFPHLHTFMNKAWDKPDMKEPLDTDGLREALRKELHAYVALFQEPETMVLDKDLAEQLAQRLDIAMSAAGIGTAPKAADPMSKGVGDGIEDRFEQLLDRRRPAGAESAFRDFQKLRIEDDWSP